MLEETVMTNNKLQRELIKVEDEAQQVRALAALQYCYTCITFTSLQYCDTCSICNACVVAPAAQGGSAAAAAYQHRQQQQQQQQRRRRQQQHITRH